MSGSNKASGLKQPQPTGGTRPKPPATTPNNAVLTVNTDDLIIGDRVFVAGTKAGHIQYIGETQFAPGEWAGVVLDEPHGKNDGSVAGVRYFQCEPKKGVFSRLTKLSKVRLAEDTTPRSASPSSTINATSSPPSPPSDNEPSVGDRVQVTSANGVKYGILRYLGATEFAAGRWAGVELDDAVGKNDGSVAGKRYFECAARYGLFAPVQKVARASPGSLRKTTTPKRVASQESLSALSAASGNRSTARVRLGVTSLASTPTRSARSNAAGVLAANSALQESLKEKEQHVDQLLRESDLERAELARAANKLEECERRLATVLLDHERYVEETESRLAEWRLRMETLTASSDDTAHRLEEERRKVEDLQFREEEQAILKGELETIREANEQKMRTLEELLQKERHRVEDLERESCKAFQSEEDVSKYLDEIETLKGRLAAAEEDARRQTSESMAQLEELLAETRERLRRSDEKVSGLESKMADDEKLRSECAELRRLAAESGERFAQVGERKDKLEADLAAMANACGDSAALVSAMNAELRDRERQLDAANDALRESRLTNESWRLDKDSTVAELSGKIAAVESRLLAESERAKAANGELTELRSRVDVAEETSRSLGERLRQSELKATSLELEKEERCRENEDLRSQLDLVLSSKRQLELDLAEKGQLESDIATLRREKQDQLMAVSERDRRLEALTAEVDRLRSEISAYKLELERKLDAENDLTRNTMQYIEAQRVEYEALRSRTEEVETEKLEEARRWSEDRRQLEDRYAELSKKYDERRDSEDAAKKETDELRTRLALSEAAAERRATEIETLKCDLETAATRDRLEKKAPERDDSELRRLTDEKETLESQIDFLNSVIVDMQKKNDESQARIALLELGDGASDITDVNLNGVRTAVAPRLYCDICERFDAHDTEDCPTQAADDDDGEETNHTRYHGTRNQQRPYCETCEVFGHWTNECDDAESF